MMRGVLLGGMGRGRSAADGYKHACRTATCGRCMTPPLSSPLPRRQSTWRERAGSPVAPTAWAACCPTPPWCCCARRRSTTDGTGAPWSWRRTSTTTGTGERWKCGTAAAQGVLVTEIESAWGCYASLPARTPCLCSCAPHLHTVSLPQQRPRGLARQPGAVELAPSPVRGSGAGDAEPRAHGSAGRHWSELRGGAAGDAGGATGNSDCASMPASHAHHVPPHRSTPHPTQGTSPYPADHHGLGGPLRPPPRPPQRLLRPPRPLPLGHRAVDARAGPSPVGPGALAGAAEGYAHAGAGHGRRRGASHGNAGRVGAPEGRGGGGLDGHLCGARLPPLPVRG